MLVSWNSDISCDEDKISILEVQFSGDVSSGLPHRVVFQRKPRLHLKLAINQVTCQNLLSATETTRFKGSWRATELQQCEAWSHRSGCSFSCSGNSRNKGVIERIEASVPCDQLGVPEEMPGEVISEGSVSVIVENLDYWRCQYGGMTAKENRCCGVADGATFCMCQMAESEKYSCPDSFLSRGS